MEDFPLCIFAFPSNQSVNQTISSKQVVSSVDSSSVVCMTRPHKRTKWLTEGKLEAGVGTSLLLHHGLQWAEPIPSLFRIPILVFLQHPAHSQGPRRAKEQKILHGTNVLGENHQKFLDFHQLWLHKQKAQPMFS